MPDWSIALMVIGAAMVVMGVLIGIVKWAVGVEDRLRALEGRR